MFSFQKKRIKKLIIITSSNCNFNKGVQLWLKKDQNLNRFLKFSSLKRAKKKIEMRAGEDNGI